MGAPMSGYEDRSGDVTRSKNRHSTLIFQRDETAATMPLSGHHIVATAHRVGCHAETNGRRLAKTQT